MRLLVKYVASVYVVPGNVKTVLALGQAAIVTEGGQRWLQVPVTNEGGTRKILKDVKLEISGMTLGGAQLKGMEGENVLARTTRLFRVPVPEGMSAVSGTPRLLLQ